MSKSEQPKQVRPIDEDMLLRILPRIKFKRILNNHPWPNKNKYQPIITKKMECREGKNKSDADLANVAYGLSSNRRTPHHQAL